MCGIFGAINFNGLFNERDFEKFVKLTDFVTYRGPDASGYVCFGTKEGVHGNRDGFDVFLGHRRLSIIDLSERGNQPFSDGSSQWIAYNGEVFNYIELRKELIKKGYLFKTNTDTEVVLKVYQEYGEEGFHHLNGMWAFALLDINTNRLIISRDRFSIKPIFYTRTKDTLFFASEIKQLLPVIPLKELNLDIMHAFLAQGLLDHNEQTFYRNIYRITSKHNLIIDLKTGTMQDRQYWDYNVGQGIDSRNPLEEFRDLLIDSVKIRLRSDVKIGALLSGGLDSSALSIIANDACNGCMETYSIIAEDQRYSEERFVKILEDKKGIRNHRLLYHHNEALNVINDVIYHCEEPFGGFSIVAQYKILEKIKRETDIIVVLSGQGGDEILMGYLKYFFFNLKELIRQKRIWETVKQILFSLIKRTVLWQFRFGEAKRYFPAFIPSSSMRDEHNFIKISGPLEPIWSFQSIVQRQMLDIDKYSVPALAHYEDRNSMAHSLETRLPFLDHRLVNFVLGLSTELKLNKGWTKYILRKSMIELPEEIRWRRDKQGFITPEEVWLKTNFRPVIEDLFKNSLLQEMGVIDSKLFLDYYAMFLNRKKNIWHADISRVLIAELWSRMFFGNGFDSDSIIIGVHSE